MALDLPRTLTPSKVTAFTNCPLAFRFSQIERRPEPPSPHAVKGTLVHAALEGLFWNHSAGARTPVTAPAELERSLGRAPGRRRVRAARSSDAEAPHRPSSPTPGPWSTTTSCWRTPTRRMPSGWSSGSRPWSTACACAASSTVSTWRPTGGLIVVDYKTGRAPSERFERGSMGGVQTYALLCESVLGPGAGRGQAAVPAPTDRHLVGRHPSRPSAASASGPWPCGRPSSGPATPRTSGPTSDPCATTATSSPPAPPSRRDEPAVSAIDEAVDAAFEPLRGRPEVDRAAAVVSNLADYGLIWVALAALKARRRGPDRRRAVVALGAAGLLLAAREPGREARRRAAAARGASRRRGPRPLEQQLPERPHSRRLLHRLRAGGLRSRDGCQRRVRHCRCGQPGPPAGPPPHRRHRRRGHRLGARAWACARSSTSSRPGQRARRGGRRRRARRGNGPARGRVETDYEAFRRDLGLPLPLRPQRP